jgi:hypothetical protein
LIISFPLISKAGCETSRFCGSVGSISCDGSSCTGSSPLTSNPWVRCDGITHYCYSDPTP